MNLYRIAEKAAESAAASGDAAKKAAPAVFDDRFIALVYGGLALFFLWQLIKGYRATRGLTEPKYEFSKKMRKLNLVLVALILAMGVYSIVIKTYLSGAMMIILGVLFYLSMKGKVIVCANGVYGEGNLYEWEEIKKWGWDTSVGDLVLLIKKRGKQEEQRVIRVGVDQMNEVNDRIREFKLDKGKSGKKKGSKK